MICLKSMCTTLTILMWVYDVEIFWSRRRIKVFNVVSPHYNTTTFFSRLNRITTYNRLHVSSAKLHDTLTRWEYKEENGKLVKYKVQTTIRGISKWQVKASCHQSLRPHTKGSWSATPTSYSNSGRLLGLQDQYKSSFPVRKHGEWCGVYKSSGLVARAHTRMSLSAASQEHLWYLTGCTQMAQAHLGMDGGELLPRCK